MRCTQLEGKKLNLLHCKGAYVLCYIDFGRPFLAFVWYQIIPGFLDGGRHTMTTNVNRIRSMADDALDALTAH
jgi:hypothetical protein